MTARVNCDASPDGARRYGAARVWVLSYVLIVVWEYITIPGTSHADSWQGVETSLAISLVAPGILAALGSSPGRLFVFGCGAAPLFLDRFLSMDRFHLWLQYSGTSTPAIVGGWIVFTLGLGVVCVLSGLLVRTAIRAH